ncbi:MAG: hypothetical protein QOG15_214 [Solirubrobacteraceae bacterium]|jgi:hypothetical protein|nr:hypothetical protein [Solirubrobacteraceae bacterium]
MSPTRTRRLAWGLVVLAVAMKLGGYIVPLAAGALELRVGDVFTLSITIAFAVLGALVASRHPRNAIGWIFLGVAVSTGFAGLGHGLVVNALETDSHPGGFIGATAAYADTSWVPFILVPASVLLLLFPTGRLPSRRWRPVAWCAYGGIFGALVTGFLNPTGGDFPTARNPLGVDGPAIDALTALSFLLLAVGMIGSAISLVVRFRRAGGVERQQIKWLSAAGALVAVVIPIMFTVYDDVGATVADMTMMTAVLTLPTAAGIAMLRYRLYDIDVVVNRALVYGALTATLAGAYLGSVLLLQLILSGATSNSSLAVAVSTLAVAALFQPARRRIQGGVDRRFYRRKYDATRTLDRFVAQLRDEVDLDALGGELRGVVHETMQPAHVSLWLRTPAP